METKNDNLSAQQSLDLITQMISEAKGKVSNSSFYFLIWGWTIAIGNFGNYAILKFTDFPQYAPVVWMLCLPVWVITMIYGRRQSQVSGVNSHLDRISMWLWISMAITITPAWVFGAKINWMVNAVILMPVGAATFLSGIIIHYRPLLIGGIIFWVAGVLCYLVSPGDQFLVGGVAVILGYLVPGYMLKYQKEQHA
ncbi:MAG: hypothetical protein JNK10_07400 [Cyclobacteriaceae bacterium]|nr:hypothetical protein [Cyclobacteriaceae bacterium]